MAIHLKAHRLSKVTLLTGTPTGLRAGPRRIKGTQVILPITTRGPITNPTWEGRPQCLTMVDCRPHPGLPRPDTTPAKWECRRVIFSRAFSFVNVS